ncbi:HAD family hydrolase [Candidatus Laterigemmans baculatus]|uniref:HAD family hydrolase n=1 Tax=Candidatus Laterigemmans baculatus TaxID=2770505 RepID=UPI0013DB0B8D|nr:HAD-IA family hydrolase [Candidatus Laterigemmans baculatus]
MPEVRGVALDMDGLMFDTEPLYELAADRLLQLRGRRYEDAVRRQMMGQPGPQAIRLMLDHYGLDEPWQAVLAEAEGIFAELIQQELRTLPGLPALLATLDALAIPYGVATSSRRTFAEDLLARGGVHTSLRFVLTGDDVTHGKPHPEIYLAAAETLGIAASSLMVFEDSGNGCAAAVAAGAVTVAVPGPHSVHHDFSGAALVADSLEDPRLLALVDQCCRRL